MRHISGSRPHSMKQSIWRTPGVILICGGSILTIALGTRHNFGLYLQPITMGLGIGREPFTIALQKLFYGISQPFTSAIVDKYGAARVPAGGAALYISGLVLMSFSTTVWEASRACGWRDTASTTPALTR